MSDTGTGAFRQLLATAVGPRPGNGGNSVRVWVLTGALGVAMTALAYAGRLAVDDVKSDIVEMRATVEHLHQECHVTEEKLAALRIDFERETARRNALENADRRHR